MSKWIRIVLKNTLDFLQGATYPVRCVLSLASGDHHADYSFGGNKGLRSNEQEDHAQDTDSNETFAMLHERSPPYCYSRLFNVSGMISESAGKICILSVIVFASPLRATAFTTSWMRIAASGPMM
jgi:hypothetical protein